MEEEPNAFDLSLILLLLALTVLAAWVYWGGPPNTWQQRAPIAVLCSGFLAVSYGQVMQANRAKRRALLTRNAEVTRQSAVITKHKTELLQRDNWLNMALRSAHMACWDWDRSRKHFSSTDQLAALFEVPTGTKITSWDDLLPRIHPHDVKEVTESIAEATAAKPDVTVRYRVVTPDGAERWLENVGKWVIEGNQPVRLMGITRDITERKKMEEEHEQLVSLVRNSSDFIAIANLDGTILYVNPSGMNLLALEATDNVGKLRINDIFKQAGTELSADFIRKSLSETGRWEGDGGLQNTRSRKLLPIWMTAFFVHHPGSKKPFCIACVARDMTARREMESQLNQAQKMEAIGQLAGGIAHDFNNLLTVIQGYAELLGVSLLNESATEAVSEIRNAASRATALTRQLLTFSRQQMVDPVLLNLNDVLNGVERLISRLLGRPIAIVKKLSPTLGTIRADSGQMEQVLMNLALHARDAMPTGGTITITTENVTIDESDKAHKAGGRPRQVVRLTFADTGRGMDEETRARLFEPFQTTKQSGKSTGLGLATVFAVIKRCGGLIEVASKPGKGTVFQIDLPRQAEAPASNQLKPTCITTLNGNETLLVVEDEDAVRSLICSVLRTEGYRVIAAPRTHDGMQFILGFPERIDLLLTDIVMPELDGRELVDRLVKSRPGVKWLYISSDTNDKVVRDGMAGDRLSFLAKPFTPSDLLIKVREILDRKPMRVNGVQARELSV